MMTKRTLAVCCLSATIGACVQESGTLQLVDPSGTSSDSTQVDSSKPQDSVSPGGTGSAACQAEIDQVVPADGAVQIAVGSPIIIDFLDGVDVQEAGYTVRLRDITDTVGVDVSSLVHVGTKPNEIVVAPISQVYAGRHYELRIRGECGEYVSEFSTSAPTWRAELAISTLDVPADVDDLRTKLGTALVALRGASSTSVTLGFGAMRSGVQDLCSVTAESVGSRADHKNTSYTSTDASVIVGGKTTLVTSLGFDVTLDASIDKIYSIETLGMRVPVRAIAHAWDETSTEICSESLTCTPCGLDPKGCVRVSLSDVAVMTSTIPFVTRSQADVDATQGCAAPPP